MTEFDLARNVLRLANRIVANRNNHLRELGLTAEQADSLLFFEKNSGATITDLKDYLGVSHQTARGIVQRMTEKNVLALTVSPDDGRCRIVIITSKGENLLRTLHQNGINTGISITKEMTADEKKDFARLIAMAMKNINA